MISLVIKFHEKADPAPIWPDIQPSSLIHLADDAPAIQVAALEGGMASGQPSVALRIDLPDGRVLVAETSALLFCTAARAIMARFPQLFDDAPAAPAAATPASYKGKKNIYTCRTCGGHIVTVDIDDGVTPFMVGCEATEGCDGHMQSSMYRVFDQKLKADYEWYKPTDLRGLNEWELDHVTMGGLLLRKVPEVRS